MRLKLIALAAVIAAALASGIAGAAPAQTPLSAASAQCTEWLPPVSSCPRPAVFATVYNDLDPWYMSNSYARRTKVTVTPYGCLGSQFRVRVRYYRQDGSIMWDSGPSAYGTCGETYNADSGPTYVKVALNLHYSGCTGCPHVTSQTLESESWWW